MLLVRQDTVILLLRAPVRVASSFFIRSTNALIFCSAHPCELLRNTAQKNRSSFVQNQSTNLASVLGCISNPQTAVALTRCGCKDMFIRRCEHPRQHMGTIRSHAMEGTDLPPFFRFISLGLPILFRPFHFGFITISGIGNASESCTVRVIDDRPGLAVNDRVTGITGG